MLRATVFVLDQTERFRKYFHDSRRSITFRLFEIAPCKHHFVTYTFEVVQILKIVGVFKYESC